MPWRNFTVPVSDCSPEAIDRTARAEDPGTCRFRCNTLGQNLASKQQTTCVPRPLWNILVRHSNGHLSRRLWRCSFCRVRPGLAMLVSERKTEVLVCIGLQLQVDGSALK
jgi:hypothetical protein